jgi:D-arabinose 1-dehydrogenase-like Zn-dependent alcohol dehydrogenase
LKSWQFRDYGIPLELVESKTPAPTGTEVVLRTLGCGVCHSDIHVWEGQYDLGHDKKLDVRSGRPLPFTLGHEIAGEVE